jgi:hypothetical protein
MECSRALLSTAGEEVARGRRTPVSMKPIVRETPELEEALLRRSLQGLAAECERCERCRRSLLVGEKVYELASGTAVCELCVGRERTAPSHSHTVHGPEFGHTMRILDRRQAVRPPSPLGSEPAVPPARLTGTRAA